MNYIKTNHMKMNLRENKIEQIEKAQQKKDFFSFKKQLKPKESQEKISQPKPQKKIEQKSAYKEPESEKWIRKEPKPQLPEEELDYQEDVEYDRTFSTYIKEHPEDILVHWRGPDFAPFVPAKNVYLIISVLIGLIVLYSVWTNNIITAIVFILIWIVGYLQINQKPTVIDFAVTYDGFLIENELYRYEDIKSFWIFYEPPHTRIISFHMRGKFRPYLHVPLHQVDPVIVHEKLTEFIEEERQDPGIIDILERMLHM
jgi:hypothetical protein